MKELLRTFFIKGTDLPENLDANGEDPIGIAPYTENWRAGVRQPASEDYGLKGVTVLTASIVSRIRLEKGVAKGAELTSGRTITANREVIVCCGSIRTPQILMLSGIGPADELSKHGIKQLIDAPEVGLNFHDHVCMAQLYKVRSSRLIYEGLALGTHRLTPLHIGQESTEQSRRRS